MALFEDCSERERLRDFHRRIVDQWLDALKDDPGNKTRTCELKSAINVAMDQLLEHRRRHDC
jgi:hypothetical protein